MVARVSHGIGEIQGVPRRLLDRGPWTVDRGPWTVDEYVDEYVDGQALPSD